MKPNILWIPLMLSLGAHHAPAQGTFVFDQQSTVDGHVIEGPIVDIRTNQPLGQSFIPALSSVGFIRLYVYDATIGGNSPATLQVNLRSDSITGTILASTDPVVLGPTFNGPWDFVFPSAVPVTPGTSYYFQPTALTADSWSLAAGAYNYAGGTVFGLGTPVPAYDLWFQEGIIVPEPPPPLLLLLGGVLFVLARPRRVAKQGHI